MELDPEYADVGSGWRMVLLLGALFAMPIAISAWLYSSGWRPVVHSAHGELVQPPRQIGNLVLGEDGGARVSLGKMGGRWTLLYFGPAECAADCMRSLYYLRQVQVAQGREEGRVQRVFVARGRVTTTGLATLTCVFPGLKIVAEGGEVASHWPDGAVPGGRIYLVDPMGNLVMRYTGDADPSGMRKDLSRLLAYSWVG
ncbi:hypothetical protein SKTS_23770 [Sulfurimicrobium lacus]|uniref:Thioredoxin domain-containing protein n=1 Tax=Sulfurimicrobium lacus TaxID=2715678 RepID=A0A6F8VE94_9PROT|nr:SCO family protein [Sulfurimicrobium lacus]BCB27491.1 hypothetical protein SKTS_23770 [Sulfurimicrobium lacus]